VRFKDWADRNAGQGRAFSGVQNGQPNTKVSDGRRFAPCRPRRAYYGILFCRNDYQFD